MELQDGKNCKIQDGIIEIWGSPLLQYTVSQDLRCSNHINSSWNKNEKITSHILLSSLSSNGLHSVLLSFFTLNFLSRFCILVKR